MVVICLGEEPPLNRAERSSHPPASLRKPTAKRRGRLSRNGPRGRMPRRLTGRCRARRDNRPMPDAGAKRRRGCGTREGWPDARPARDLRQLDARQHPVKEKRNRRPFFTVLQPSDRFAAVAPLQPHYEGAQCAAFAQSEVVPKISHVVHFETRRAFFPQRGKIHTVAVAFVLGLNAPPCEELPDADIFQIIHNVCFSKFSDIALLPTTFA